MSQDVLLHDLTEYGLYVGSKVLGSQERHARLSFTSRASAVGSTLGSALGCAGGVAVAALGAPGFSGMVAGVGVYAGTAVGRRFDRLHRYLDYDQRNAGRAQDKLLQSIWDPQKQDIKSILRRMKRALKIPYHDIHHVLRVQALERQYLAIPKREQIFGKACLYEMNEKEQHIARQIESFWIGRETASSERPKLIDYFNKKAESFIFLQLKQHAESRYLSTQRPPDAKSHALVMPGYPFMLNPHPDAIDPLMQHALVRYLDRQEADKDFCKKEHYYIDIHLLKNAAHTWMKEGFFKNAHREDIFEDLLKYHQKFVDKETFESVMHIFFVQCMASKACLLKKEAQKQAFEAFQMRARAGAAQASVMRESLARKNLKMLLGFEKHKIDALRMILTTATTMIAIACSVMIPGGTFWALLLGAAANVIVYTGTHFMHRQLMAVHQRYVKADGSLHPETFTEIAPKLSRKGLHVAKKAVKIRSWMLKVSFILAMAVTVALLAFPPFSLSLGIAGLTGVAIQAMISSSIASCVGMICHIIMRQMSVEATTYLARHPHFLALKGFPLFLHALQCYSARFFHALYCVSGARALLRWFQSDQACGPQLARELILSSESTTSVYMTSPLKRDESPHLEKGRVDKKDFTGMIGNPLLSEERSRVISHRLSQKK